MKNKEIWKDIKGYEGLYQVSNKGRVRGVDRILCNGAKWKGRVLKFKKVSSGYLGVTLCKNNNIDQQLVHRLVADSFIPKEGKKLTVNHKDGVKYNNAAENLEWLSYSGNLQHAYDNRLRKAPHEKSVIQYSIDGSYIASFKSMAEASRRTGVNRQDIGAVANKKRRQAGGYVWKLKSKKS